MHLLHGVNKDMLATPLKSTINVMIVNDSSYMLEIISDMLSSEQHIVITSKARDGLEALRKLKSQRPDVILLDLEMPNMDGLTFIQEVVKESIIPIIVVSNYSQLGAKLILDSLELGALDFISIPQEDPEFLRKFKNSLISKIEIAAKSNPLVAIPDKISKLKPNVEKKFSVESVASKVIVVGASTGAPKVITDILTALPNTLPAGVLVVQHMPKDFTTNFAQRLNDVSKLEVREAKEGDVIKNGLVLLAPGDYHMTVGPDKRIKLNQSPKRFGVRPSANVTMVSASEVFGANVIGVLLSGMGQDGAFGMKMIKKRQGITLAQDEATSVVFGMAKAANELNAVDRLVPMNSLATEIEKELEKIV